MGQEEWVEASGAHLRLDLLLNHWQNSLYTKGERVSGSGGRRGRAGQALTSYRPLEILTRPSLEGHRGHG